MSNKAELVQVDDKSLVEATQTQEGQMISMIERMALNPDVDVDKLERMFSLHEKMLDRQAEQLFNQAMSDAQAKMRRVSADATNPQTRSNYASYSALDKALRPIYTGAGLALSFDTADSPKEDHVRVVCYLSHSGGHSRTYHVDMCADGKGAKGGAVMTQTHAAGSAMSYGMRYLLKLIFNVAVGEDDDDGNYAGQPVERITEDQATALHAMITENEIDMDAVLNWLKKSLKCDSLENISVAAYDTVLSKVNATIKQRKANAENK